MSEMAFRKDGRLWPSSQCDLKIDGPGWPVPWRTAAQSAITTWNSPGHRFSFVSAPSAANHLAAYDLERWNGWLGMTYTQPSTRDTALTSGHVLINLHYEWDPAHPSWPHRDRGGPYDLESALVHEFGHLLHLDDEVTAKNVMQPTLKPRTLRRSLGPDDKEGIAHLYPLLSAFTPSQLGTHAAAVVQGKVIASNYAVMSARIAPGDLDFPDLYFSVSRVKVSRTWSGGIGCEEVDVLTLGAHTPDVSLHVTSEAALEPNEEVVLFLSIDLSTKRYKSDWELTCWNRTPQTLPTAPYSIFGGFQGKYSVYRRGDAEYAWRPGLARTAEGDLLLAELERQSISGI